MAPIAFHWHLLVIWTHWWKIYSQLIWELSWGITRHKHCLDFLQVLQHKIHIKFCFTDDASFYPSYKCVLRDENLRNKCFKQPFHLQTFLHVRFHRLLVTDLAKQMSHLCCPAVHPSKQLFKFLQAPWKLCGVFSSICALFSELPTKSRVRCSFPSSPHCPPPTQSPPGSLPSFSTQQGSKEK